jgi:trk system potassium uptake protein
LTSATLLVTMVLMFIGASPGSTAGGIKTTTVAVLWAAIRGNLRNRANTELYNRTIPQEVIQKAVTVLCCALALLACFSLALLMIEDKPFVDVVFETISAFGTVGLSTGITPKLTVPGKVLITALMFVGRLGPLTIAYSLVRNRQPARYEYAEERVTIG